MYLTCLVGHTISPIRPSSTRRSLTHWEFNSDSNCQGPITRKNPVSVGVAGPAGPFIPPCGGQGRMFWNWGPYPCIPATNERGGFTTWFSSHPGKRVVLIASCHETGLPSLDALLCWPLLVSEANAKSTNRHPPGVLQPLSWGSPHFNTQQQITCNVMLVHT